jgi:membrane protease YdiL (CAAX protease family)
VARYKALPVMAVTVVVVLAVGIGIGYVRPAFKLSSATWAFLAVNLFFTVVAEEAFFRGFRQDRLAASLGRGFSGRWIAIALSALVFGLVHLGGGLIYSGLASLAGSGYAIAYARTQKIEIASATHFLLNAVHVIGFTYPFIQQT